MGNMRLLWMWRGTPAIPMKSKSLLTANGSNSFLWGEPEEEGEAAAAVVAAAALALWSFEYLSKPVNDWSVSRSWKRVGLLVKKHSGRGCEVEAHNPRWPVSL